MLEGKEFDWQVCASYPYRWIVNHLLIHCEIFLVLFRKMTRLPFRKMTRISLLKMLRDVGFYQLKYGL